MLICKLDALNYINNTMVAKIHVIMQQIKVDLISTTKIILENKFDATKYIIKMLQYIS